MNRLVTKINLMLELFRLRAMELEYRYMGNPIADSIADEIKELKFHM